MTPKRPPRRLLRLVVLADNNAYSAQWIFADHLSRSRGSRTYNRLNRYTRVMDWLTTPAYSRCILPVGLIQEEKGKKHEWEIGKLTKREKFEDNYLIWRLEGVKSLQV